MENVVGLTQGKFNACNFVLFNKLVFYFLEECIGNASSFVYDFSFRLK